MKLIEELDEQTDTDMAFVAELKTIASMTHPTKLTKEEVQLKLESGIYTKHGITLSCIQAFETNVQDAVLGLLQEE